MEGADSKNLMPETQFENAPMADYTDAMKIAQSTSPQPKKVRNQKEWEVEWSEAHDNQKESYEI